MMSRLGPDDRRTATFRRSGHHGDGQCRPCGCAHATYASRPHRRALPVPGGRYGMYVAATPYDAQHGRAILVDVPFVSSYWTKVDDGLSRVCASRRQCRAKLQGRASRVTTHCGRQAGFSGVVHGGEGTKLLQVDDRWSRRRWYLPIFVCPANRRRQRARDWPHRHTIHMRYVALFSQVVFFLISARCSTV